MTWLFCLTLMIGLANSEAPDCSRCDRFPRLCEDVSHCVQLCGTLKSFTKHCEKLKSFEGLVHAEPERRASAVRQDESAATAGDVRTVMQKMMSPGGTGPHRDEM
mmetsp:Transcript_39164/g.93615  ORF Transcript_39164/g.93615 Transcript_39164/m.93615 type:complete len:105 (+) Transcript_39164:28-342(+)